ncbi:MAG: hypothetical protein ACRBB4_09285 [Neptuniibacter sp.]
MTKIKNLIEEVLDELPEAYDDEPWPRACSEVFMPSYKKHPSQGQSVYTH